MRRTDNSERHHHHLADGAECALWSGPLDGRPTNLVKVSPKVVFWFSTTTFFASGLVFSLAPLLDLLAMFLPCWVSL